MTPEPASDHAPSLWFDTAPPPPGTGPLEAAIDTDVAIVGGGFTGLSCAEALARAGNSIAVVEAREIGSGASGRNNGQVIPTLSRMDPDDLIKEFGPDVGERFVNLLGTSASKLFDLVRHLNIDCEAEQNGWVQPVHSPGRMAIAERRCAQWTRHGMEVDLLDRDAMRSLLGSDAWFGGWTAKTGGSINPLALARGLAGAVIDAGGQVFTQTPARRITHDGNRWVIETPKGRVTANGLMLATNAYTDDVNRDLRRAIVPVVSWQMATEPLSDNVRKSILPGRQAVSDTRGDLRFFRYNTTGRLVTGAP